MEQEEASNRLSDSNVGPTRDVRELEKEYARRLCTAALNIDKQRSLYEYLANLTLQALTEDRKRDPGWEFKSIKDWIEDHYTFDHLVMLDLESRETLPEKLALFFEGLSARLASVVNEIIWIVREGLPVYNKDSNGAYCLATPDSEDYQFLRLLGKHEETRSHWDSLPAWAHNLYVKRFDFIAHGLFFSDLCGKDWEKAEAVRIAALKAFLDGKLDVEIDSTSTGGNTAVRESNRIVRRGDHNTRLMDHQNRVLQRYYGANFDPKDRDTWSTQQEIVGWLMKTHNLSKREAEAIDLVTRPDSSRKK